ncbi:monomeric [FeFe] hydrogenase [Candidatus Endomicrobiellum agilis]|uniref:monomeric [FeFe] hydrogenase n=1 Tax=Candidatus Endomicrobiellum agilis TaxID=3238957 RepID=UPI00358CA0C1|nr:monomeric [FeFe] hydrogenase [Endomicrobium sp.]
MNNNNQEIHLKKEVLERIIRAFFSRDFKENVRLIPFDMRPKGSKVLYRCCIYKERAVLKDRVIAGLGFAIEDDDKAIDLSNYAQEALERKKPEENPLAVVEAACKGCVPRRIYVTDLCQGCVANLCSKSCKFGAISIIGGKSVIDSSKCKNCRMCITACPYNAIVKITVPCEDACPVDAIKKNENGTAQIDYKTCIYCGKCIMSCPFGAVHEKSQIIDVLKNIVFCKRVIALLAPSIVGQFTGNIYQLKSAIIKAGFSDAYEVAQGADATTINEAREFKERIKSGETFITTSCCASYYQLIKKHLPEAKPFFSNTNTPLYYIAKKVKSEHKDAIVVFISPCVSKKKEAQENGNVDYVINYEELMALFNVKDIEVQDCKEEKFDIESSRQGRGFGVTGGVVSAVSKLLEGKDLARPYVINGLNKETIKQLKRIVKDKKCAEGNLIEVMGCEGGCVGGNATVCASKVAGEAIKVFLEKSEDIVEK